MINADNSTESCKCDNKELTASGARQNGDDTDEHTQHRVDTNEQLVSDTCWVPRVVDEQQHRGDDSRDHQHSGAEIQHCTTAVIVQHPTLRQYERLCGICCLFVSVHGNQ